MTHLRTHILYEYGIDTRPHSSSYIRLIRPLTHPSLANHLEVTYSPRLPEQSMDVVIIDRLWRPDITPALADHLVKEILSQGIRLIYALDDNLLDLTQERSDWPQEHHLLAMHIFMQAADAVWVTTTPLKERLSELNQNIAVIPNALDERLLCSAGQPAGGHLFEKRVKKIGFMGTMTHDRDLTMIVPALRELWFRHPDEFEVEIVGVAGNEETIEALSELPVQVIYPPPEEQEYPLFQLWFTSHVNWDIAIAPLIDTPFNSCKSDIKFLDYCAIGAAGIYSRVPAYIPSIQHLETGLLVGNQVQAWTDALEECLTNQELCLHISRKASRYLYQERTLSQTAHNWLDTLMGVIG